MMKEGLFRNLGLKLFSLCLAFALWLVVAGEQREEHTLKVPFKLTRLPERMVLVNDPGDVVTVKLRGPKSLVSGLPPDEVNLNLELSRLVEGENLVGVKVEEIQVPRGVEVLQASPKVVRLVLESMADREVRVAARVEGTPAAGHYFRRASARPDRVRVVGPKSEVRRVTRVYTATVSIEGRSRDFAVWTTLEPVGKSVKVDGADSVQVSVEIGGGGRRQSS
ncbi:MAG: CdaR family protein [candidate division NC10 bacterium]